MQPQRYVVIDWVKDRISPITLLLGVVYCSHVADAIRAAFTLQSGTLVVQFVKELRIVDGLRLSGTIGF